MRQFLISFICPKCLSIGEFVYETNGKKSTPLTPRDFKISERINQGYTKPICKNCGYYNIQIEGQLNECLHQDETI